MKYKLLISTALSLIILSIFAVQPAQAAGVQDTPLCLPGQPDNTNSKCQSLGPAAYLKELKSQGLALPRNPLPVIAIDPGFSDLPYNYLRLHSDEIPIFSSLDEAIANQNPYRVIPPGFNFVTYIDYYQGAGGGRHYMIAPGIWVRGGHTSGRVVSSSYKGMTFAGTPDHQFGWVLDRTESQPWPGKSSLEFTGRTLNRYDLIQVYRTENIDGVSWLMIGPDEWIEKSKTGLVYPADSPPEGVDNGRWIEINLLEQTVSVYQDNRLVFATLTSTGIPGWWTRPGLFQIYEKLESTPMSGAFEADRSDYYYLEDVPWTMYFDEARALHGAYWHDYFGYEQSHGCVNLSPGDAHWLYLWANVGDYVYVWDPSGKTPTDSSLYTAGGA